LSLQERLSHNLLQHLLFPLALQISVFMLAEKVEMLLLEAVSVAAAAAALVLARWLLQPDRSLT
jgi:hypothetical protein